MVEEFHKALDHSSCKTNTAHHDQAPTIQTTFGIDVLSLIIVMEDFSNPFEKESTDHLVLYNKEIADPVVVEAINNAQRIGKENYQAFAKRASY